MERDTSNNTTRLFFIVGLIFVCLGVLFDQALIVRLSQPFGVNLNLGGAEGIARIWVLKTIFILLGIPLLLYKYKSRSPGKLFFDASMGLLFLAISLLFIEGIFYFLNSSKPPAQAAQRSMSYSEFYVDLDEHIGYKLKPNLQVTARQTEGDKLIYEAVYSIDEHGRRITPVDNREARTRFILFFGASFTFAEGVQDGETMPAYVGRIAPAYMPYNYGVPGFGTQQVLALLQTDGIAAGVSETQGIAIYNFICPHIDRVVGSLLVQNTSGTYMPFYFLNPEGELVRKGTLASGRPIHSILYAMIGISQTAKYFNVTLPRLNDYHFELTARIIEESGKRIRDKFDSDHFYVLIYPGYGDCASELLPHLDRAKVKYFDYSDLFSRGDGEFWLPDGHPSAKGYEVVAEQLATDLGIIGQFK